MALNEPFLIAKICIRLYKTVLYHVTTLYIVYFIIYLVFCNSRSLSFKYPIVNYLSRGFCSCILMDSPKK